MYDFIYFFFFKYFLWKGDNDPKDSAIYGVLLAVFFHLFFILTAINFALKINVLELAFEKGQSKYIFLPIVILAMIFIHRVYKNRTEKIITKYLDRKDFFGWRSAFVVVLTVVGPLLAGIYFLNNH